MRIAELTVPQILGLLGGLMCGLVFALYVSPFSPYLTLCLSIYIASIPAGTVILATSTEFDLWLYVKACVGERLSDDRYAAGPGEQFTGYVIEPDLPSGRERGVGGERLDLGALWVP
ncbi:MAG: hypothetical protein ABSH36_04525 [Solirubrobacteraceae bacterium]